MRVGVVQTVIPRSSDFEGDSELKLAPTDNCINVISPRFLAQSVASTGTRDAPLWRRCGIELLVFPELFQSTLTIYGRMSYLSCASIVVLFVQALCFIGLAPMPISLIQRIGPFQSGHPMEV